MGVTGVGSPKDNSIAIKKADGTVVARVNRTGSKNKKKKKLNYNYREISGQLMRTATSVGARVVMVRAFQKVGTLYRKLKSGDYSEKEVERAIAHAEQIAMVAKKRMKHLQEEERLKKGGPCEAEMEEESEEAGTEMLGMENAENTKLDSEEIERLMEELEATLEEIDRMEQMGELEEVATGVQEDMDPEDLKLLKKKHRSKELKESMEADMKYLKALFYQLEKERRENASGAGGSGNSASGNGSGVSLELAGVEMAASMPEAPVEATGGSIDVTV